MQSEADAERARQLGARAELVRVCGNLKYDQPGAGGCGPGFKETQDFSNHQSPNQIAYCEIDDQLGLSLLPQLIVAGSTAPGEEEMLLASLRELRKHSGLERARLLVAPDTRGF
jgi:3-deoxy-D-manno-octulosonic-acid transferase